jgi:hypothetical protein
MAKEHGRSLALTPFRRLVADLMRFSQKVPAVTAERRMSLASLRRARLRCAPRPAWVVLFAKALALVARRHPELRRSYMAFPWPRFYESHSSTATINVERRLADETIVVQCVIRRPENRSLSELDAMIRHFQSEPVERLRWYERAVAMSKVPWPVRPVLWWGALNVLGRRRCDNFGTFGLSSVAGHGAGLLHIIPVLSSMLHYGLFSEGGELDMRLTWDHRVMDGALAARILVELEKTLQGEIVAELTAMRYSAAA